MLELYSPITGATAIDHLRQLARLLKGIKVVHVNSTAVGGGVAEILAKLVPLEKEVGIEARWEVITGGAEFYQCTKSFHNALQGNQVHVPEKLLKVYEDTNAKNLEILEDTLRDADMIFIHDPQPAPLLRFWRRNRKGARHKVTGQRPKWIWRCHIDASHPYGPVWKYLRQFILEYDASIFSLPDFAQTLPHPQYLIPPSIDPLSDKNMELDDDEVRSICGQFDLDLERPFVLQVSRFDRFKDPLGVIQAYNMVKRFLPALQLVLAGGGAADDPEGEIVLKEVQAAASEDRDIHILMLPPDAHRIINALQRGSQIVIQKSLREGFGLTVTEGMWKGKPVIGGDTGGIRLQVVNHHTGFLVSTPEGAALRIRYLFQNREKLQEMGDKAREFVREHFLITRQLREHLTLMVGLLHANTERIELG
ncbi:MAG: glycosyltransferase [Acidobacteriota bacterium]